MTYLTIFRVTQILYSFTLVLEKKTGKEIPESSRLEFLDTCQANSFALSRLDQVKLERNQANAKQYAEVGLFLVENYSNSSCKSNRSCRSEIKPRA